LADSHLQDFTGGSRSTALYIYCIGVGTIQATERTALKEYDKPQPRTIESAH